MAGFEKMKNLPPQPCLSLQLLTTVNLPSFGCDPGPLHTIVEDGQKNLYYSDEINHSLVSLHESGGLRWHLTRRGKKTGEFLYPKGIELGWINDGGSRHECVAVCDSWNRRIQFFDRHGRFLTCWDRAGDIFFNDVVDVRFFGADPEPCWMVLDREHHCLFVLDPSGTLLFRMGRALPENLESRWPTPGDKWNSQSSPMESFRECLPYDPLFMPLRIFGSTRDALFIWEPRSSRLKQAVAGNLLPVWIGLPCGSDWIGAGDDGWIAFNRNTESVSIYDLESKTWQSAAIEGLPVPCGRLAGEIWVQMGASVRHFRWDAAREENGVPNSLRIPRTVLRLVAEMESRAREGDEATVRDDPAHSLRALGKRVQDLMNSGIPDEKEALAIRSELALIPEQAAVEMRRSDFPLFQAALKLQQARSFSHSGESGECLGQVVKLILNQANHPLVDFLLFRDEWILTMPQRTASCEIRTAWQEQMRALIDAVAAAALAAMELVAKGSWIGKVVESAIDEPDSLEVTPCSAGSVAPRGPAIERSSVTVARSSGFLRELGRILVGEHDSALPAQPAALSHFQNQHLLVTLQGANAVVKIDSTGKVCGPLDTYGELHRPFGIAVDAAGRVWISEPLKDSIRIVDVSRNRIAGIEELYGPGLALQCPYGIQRAPDGSMFVADLRNNRIAILKADGRVHFLGRGEGTEPGKFRHPASCCFGDSEEAVWVVDLRNHRLQKITLDGIPLQQVGAPGLGRARLIMPEFSVIYDDGVMVVNQWACMNALRIFSSHGDELGTVCVEYAPRGMMIHQGRLFVCAGNGNHIYVYERA